MKPITKGQLADLWIKEFAPHGHCCLCGNSGQIDTREKVFTAAGIDVGAQVWCICPNGRAMKRGMERAGNSQIGR
jgi:hypothetical protein